MTDDEKMAEAYDYIEMGLGALAVVAETLEWAGERLRALADKEFEAAESRIRVGERLLQDAHEQLGIAYGINDYLFGKND